MTDVGTVIPRGSRLLLLIAALTTAAFLGALAAGGNPQDWAD